MEPHVTLIPTKAIAAIVAFDLGPVTVLYFWLFTMAGALPEPSRDDLGAASSTGPVQPVRRPLACVQRRSKDRPSS